MIAGLRSSNSIRMLTTGVESPRLLRSITGIDVGVDEPVVLVRLVDLAHGGFPPGIVEHGRVDVLAPDDVHRSLRQRQAVVRERIVALDLLVGEVPVAPEREGADPILLALVDVEFHQPLAARPVHDDRVVQDLEIQEAVARKERGDSLAEVAGVLLVVERALPEPEEALRAGLHRRRDLLRGHALVPVDDESGDGHPWALRRCEA